MSKIIKNKEWIVIWKDNEIDSLNWHKLLLLITFWKKVKSVLDYYNVLLFNKNSSDFLVNDNNKIIICMLSFKQEWIMVKKD